MLKIGIIGATGYTGRELIKILLNHPDVELAYLSSTTDRPLKVEELFPDLRKVAKLSCEPFNTKKAQSCDLLFLATPHGLSMSLVPKLLKGRMRIVDLSGDFRLKGVASFKKYYKMAHKAKGLLKEAVYGLPEINREKIAGAKLVANPGCYATSVILAAFPILVNKLAEGDTVIADSKSGTTGAGKKLEPFLNFSEADENIKPYRVNTHQHIPEIEQALKAKLVFTPQLAPYKRGILSCVYIKTKKGVSQKSLFKAYEEQYADEPFIRLIDEGGKFPEIKDVAYTNFCDIKLIWDAQSRVATVISAIDNLMKGASSQAVQNMNIMCGFDERAGLLEC